MSRPRVGAGGRACRTRKATVREEASAPASETSAGTSSASAPTARRMDVRDPVSTAHARWICGGPGRHMRAGKDTQRARRGSVGAAAGAARTARTLPPFLASFPPILSTLPPILSTCGPRV